LQIVPQRNGDSLPKLDNIHSPDENVLRYRLFPSTSGLEHLRLVVSPESGTEAAGHVAVDSVLS
jgi:hypothetical protein